MSSGVAAQDATPLSCYNFDWWIHLRVRHYFPFFCFAQNFVGFADPKIKRLRFAYTGAIRNPLSNILAVRRHRPTKSRHSAPLLSWAPQVLLPHKTTHRGSQAGIRLVILFAAFRPPLPFRSRGMPELCPGECGLRIAGYLVYPL